jgi:hypothetical protein
MDKIGVLPLAQKGLKISPNEIYNPAGTGLSVAVPRLSSGALGGRMVSVFGGFSLQYRRTPFWVFTPLRRSSVSADNILPQSRF